jgi:glutamate carboxypeptidase
MSRSRLLFSTLTVLHLLPILGFAQTPESRLSKKIDATAEKDAAFLQRLVDQNSGTFHLAGVRKIGDMMDAELKQLGFTTRFIDNTAIQRAPHLIAEKKGTGRPILMIGHMDTVFEPSSPFQKFEAKGRSANGPGTSDMKGGLVVLLSALRALQEEPTLKDVPLTVFLTGDEEAPGDLTMTRKDLIAEGKKARVALCFETGVRMVDKDYASTARRGFTGWTLKSKGKAGHSGGIFSENAGYGAIYEISRIVNEFQATLKEPNMTFNVGMILGGANPQADRAGKGSVEGKDNIIAADAMAIGEIRALSVDQLARIKDRMHGIVAKSLPGTSSVIEFREGYPPMAPTAGNKRLLKILNEGSVAAGLGELGELDPMQRGAGDVSFVAPYVDALTGLGAIGRGAHAVGESVDLASIPVQAKRAAALILRVAKDVK